MKRRLHLARAGFLAAGAAFLTLAPSAGASGEPVVVPALEDREIDAALKTLRAGLESEAKSPASRRSSALRTFTSTALVVRGLGKNRSLTEEQAGRIAAELTALKEKHPPQAAAIDQAIFKAKYLTIGRQAPEIEGEDTDGVSFKLSDYRGKVVVLDFWGDW